jgi:hypothetical protein
MQLIGTLQNTALSGRRESDSEEKPTKIFSGRFANRPYKDRSRDSYGAGLMF